MTSIAVKTIDFGAKKQSESTKEFKLSSDVADISERTLAYTVRWQLARRRSGSAKTKTMAEISGTTAKPYKQKGTGRARQGSKRSVQFVGGRTCHGPMPRSFDFSMPKKIIERAVADALKIKIKDNKISLFADVASDKIKTAEINKVLQDSKINSALIVFDSAAKNSQALIRAAKNLKSVKTLDIKAINAYDILKFDQIIVDNKIFESNILGAL